MKDYRIVDSHAHIFPIKISDKAVKSIGDFYDIGMGGKGRADELIKKGSSIGVTNYVVHSVATVPKQVAAINDYIALEIDKHPELIGLATLHPDLEDIRGEVDRAESMGLKGIKLHPDFQEFNIDCDAALKIYEAVDGRFPILVHMGDSRTQFSKPHRLRRVMEMFPNQIFIAAHFGGYSDWDEAEEYIIGQNCYIDTSSSLHALSKERAVKMIRNHGVDKVLFGTDYPMWDYREELDKFMALDLTEEERVKILGQNTLKLFNVD